MEKQFQEFDKLSWSLKGDAWVYSDEAGCVWAKVGTQYMDRADYSYFGLNDHISEGTKSCINEAKRHCERMYLQEYAYRQQKALEQFQELFTDGEFFSWSTRWADYTCHWCGKFEREGHSDDCELRAALATQGGS